ncbi:MAG: hypothetical protein ACRCZ0_11525 [Cetobacterium sp.]
MALTIIDGLTTLGGLGTQHYTDERAKEIAIAMAQTIVACNTGAVLGAENMTAICLGLEEIVPRVAGQPIAIETTNITFTEGGIQSEADGFSTYFRNFTLKKGRGRQAKAFSHDSQEILDARNRRISLLVEDQKALKRIADAYAFRYNPNVRLLSLLTGSSLTTKVPTKATEGSDDDFQRAFGWLRGENVADFIPAIYGVEHANHFRAKKGDAIAKSDITDILDLLTKYDGYSGEGIIAIANQRTIEDLASLYSAPTNVDKMYIDGVYSPSFLGATWVEVPQMHGDFILFLDAGKRDLIKRCVNPDEAQRGLKLLEENKTEAYNIEEGINGVKAYVFEEEFIVASRFSGAILDKGRKATVGSDMSDEGIAVLEGYASLVEKMYNR